MIAPNTAVTTKFADVLITLTRTVLLASVRARVKSPHITPLKVRFSAKKNCVRRQSVSTDICDRTRLAPLTRYSTSMLSSSRPKKWEMVVAQEVVS